MYPRAITYIGLSVTDLDKAIEFYKQALGLNIINGPSEFNHDNPVSADFFGKEFKKTKVVFMGSGNGVAIEIFEYQEPKAERRANNFEYWKTGIFHFCIIDPNVKEATERIQRNGGKLRSKIWDFEGRQLAYCEDPFGNIIEIYSHSTEQMVSNSNV